MSNIFSDAANLYGQWVGLQRKYVGDPVRQGLYNLNDAYVNSGAAKAVQYVAPWSNPLGYDPNKLSPNSTKTKPTTKPLDPKLYPPATPGAYTARSAQPGQYTISPGIHERVDKEIEEQKANEPKPNPPGQRVNQNNIVQKGRDLSSSTLGRQMLLEVPELDANRFIQPSEGATPAPGAGLNLNMPGVSAESFYKQPPVPFQIADEAGPKFAMEMSPESLKASENAFSTDMTKYTPLLTNIQETEAKKEEPKPSRQRGSARQQEFAARPGNQPFGGEEPATADLVSPMYANAARNAARNAVLDVRPGEGPMGTIRRRNAAVGLNAAGNIAKIDGVDYNVSPEQAWALTGGAGNTREGLDAIKNAATPYVAPGTQSPGMQVDTSNLTPGAKAAVDLAMSGPKPFTTQDMNDQNAGERLDQFNLLKVDSLSPAEQATYNAAMSSPTSFTTQGMNKENSGEYIDRFVDMNTQGMTPPDAEEFRKRFMSALQTRS